MEENERVQIYWCLSHDSNAEGSTGKCFYALSRVADPGGCELVEAEIKLVANDEPRYDSPLPLPPIEEWVNRNGTW